MEELLKEMMNHGLSIFPYEVEEPDSPIMPRPKFVLKKIPTPVDERESVCDDSTSMEYFATYDEALAKAKEVLNWEEEEEPVEACWQGTIMYKHALGPRFEDLGTTEDCDYREAMIYFNRAAESFVCEYANELGIGEFEVKVRPCPK